MWIFKKIHFHTRYDYICICVSFYCNFFNVVLCMLPYPHCAYNKSCKYVSVSGTVHWSVLFGGIRTQSKCLKKSSLLFSIYGIRHRERLWISEYDYCAQRPAISISNWKKNRMISFSMATTASQPTMTHCYCISILLQFIRIVMCLLNIVNKLI